MKKASQPVFVAGEWIPTSSSEFFHAVTPETGEELDWNFPVSDWSDVERALEAGRTAALELTHDPAVVPSFLEAFAEDIETSSDELMETAHLETALPVSPRLEGELARTTDQLRQAAWAAKDKSWRQATIDTSSGIRSILAPLRKPVAVFGPNNFPFAFNSVCGGDAAAALAAGNPIIAKGNPAHPRTTQLLGEAATRARDSAGAPAAIVQLIYRVVPEVGLSLVSDTRLGAVGFTGSKQAGLTLKRAADEAGIPFYAEMGSLNPVFVLPAALSEKLKSVVGDLVDSALLGAGQFCTKPGLVAIPAGSVGDTLVKTLADRFAQAQVQTLLSDPGHLVDGLEAVMRQGGRLLVGGKPVPGNGFRFENTLLAVDVETLLDRTPDLARELFGPITMIVMYETVEDLEAVARSLEGNLTGSIYSTVEDEAIYERIEPELRTRVGRLLNDKMPTGVAVVPSMNHGGPFPATGHPGFTSVGVPASLTRFAMLQSYDNVPEPRLPKEVRNPNPTGTMWRYIDRNWSQGDVS
jgi:2,5-dioxopentanoate dehydrogenase